MACDDGMPAYDKLCECVAQMSIAQSACQLLICCELLSLYIFRANERKRESAYRGVVVPPFFEEGGVGTKGEDSPRFMWAVIRPPPSGEGRLTVPLGSLEENFETSSEPIINDQKKASEEVECVPSLACPATRGEGAELYERGRPVFQWVLSSLVRCG